MPIQTRLVEYTHDGTLLEAFMAWDDHYAAPRPGVLIAHPWAGRVEFTEEKAKQLAAQGYVGFALDMYGKGVRGHSREENASLMQQQLLDRQALQKRMLAALQCISEQTEVNADKVAAIGYCFGGLCVLDLARSGADFAGAVSFHGLLGSPETASKKINAPVLVLHGYDDPMAPPEQLEALQKELTAAGTDWQTHAFGGVVHAFTNPEADSPEFGTVYDHKADRRSWVVALDFLGEVLNEV